MEIKAVKFRRDGYYTAPFAFGGEEGMEKYDINEKYRGSLQNYLIDTGSEVILVDTGFPKDTPEEVPDEKSLGFTGHDITDYMTAFENLEGKKVVDLNNMPETIPVGEITFKTASGKYVCSVCGYVYDPKVGDPDNGIPAGTKFEDLPDDWHCPRCKQTKEKFNKA